MHHAVPEKGLDQLLIFARHRYEESVRSPDRDLAAWARSFVDIIDAMEAHLQAAPPGAYDVRRSMLRTAVRHRYHMDRADSADSAAVR